jgi:hypothetical protein
VVSNYRPISILNNFSKICTSVFDSVCIRIPTRIIRDYSAFTVNRNFKVSPAARCVSAANANSKDIGIFNRDYISLTDAL